MSRTEGPSPRTVLITGATGALGPAVIRAFTAAGCNVRTLSRHAPRTDSLAASYPHVAADITDLTALARAMTGVDAVVHMAALLHVHPGADHLPEYHRVNVEGTSAVVEAARRCAVRRIVYLSSIAVYGGGRDFVDEETEPKPETEYASTKLLAERLVVPATSADGSPLGVILRLGAVYGPSVKGNYERLVRALARGRFVPVGRGTNRRTLVFENDVGTAVVAAASHPAAAGQVFNVTDGQVHTVTAITGAISRALGRHPPRLSIPLGIARAFVACIQPPFRLAGWPPPITTATLEKYTEDVAVRGQRIREAVGFEPRWPLEDGWRRTIDQMRSEGRL